MQNLKMIVLVLYDGQKGLHIVRRTVGLENHKGLTDSIITVGGHMSKSSILVIEFD
jgi:hypothetical protein